MRARLFAIATAILTPTVAGSAHAKPAAAPAAPPLAAPPLTLTVTPGTAGGPWKVRVANGGELPMRISADPRLLALRITPAPDHAHPSNAKPAAVTCALPEDARPATDEGHELVVPGKRSWSADFDPLFYCFDAKARAALAAGATIEARFGFPAPKTKKPAPPFVAEPVGAADGKLAPVKALESTPVTLAETFALPPAAGVQTAGPLEVSVPETLDVARGDEIPVTVTLGNDGDRPVTLLFRGATVGFRVSGPSGGIACATASAVEPIRELYTTLAPKGRDSLALLISSMCGADAFDEPGVYRVTPTLDTTKASGRPIGLRTWDGIVEGKRAMLLRVRNARHAPPPKRATLD